MFTSDDGPLVLSQVADDVAHHPGVVWLPIISLRREDAARLGYDNAERWRKLLSAHAMDMAKAMKIPDAQFRWYAAFHDEGNHPHLHMVCYSADGKSGFLTKRGIADIKSMLAKEIFQQDLYAIYQRQTQRRDELTKDAGEVMAQLVTEMQTETLENQRIQRLKHCSGKKQYGYLPPAVKSLVDEIVTELEKDPRIAAAYNLWHQEREEVLRTYKDDLPGRIPLVRQKEFKRIKNIVIKEAVRLGNFVPPDIPTQTETIDVPSDGEPSDEPADTSKVTPHIQWTRRYRLARQLMQGDGDGPADFSAAFDLLTEEANAGNALAMADLGRMYAEGVGTEQNYEEAARWLEKVAERGNSLAKYQLGKLLLTGADAVPKNVDRAPGLLTECAELGNQYAQKLLDHVYGSVFFIHRFTPIPHGPHLPGTVPPAGGRDTGNGGQQAQEEDPGEEDCHGP